jgi:hypothetical protein
LYLGTKKYAGPGMPEHRVPRWVREEHRKVKGLAADLSLDRHSLEELIAQKAGAFGSAALS